ncbi:MAG: hypothetical protein KGO51_01025, partial [Alphaproteobacteria bacterium]|nr:hypothetical protein [Alphaproteobacteria bacterium]
MQRLDELDRWSRSLQSGAPLKLSSPIQAPPGLIFRTSTWRSATGSTIDQMPLGPRIVHPQSY